MAITRFAGLTLEAVLITLGIVLFLLLAVHAAQLITLLFILIFVVLVVVVLWALGKRLLRWLAGV